MKNKFTSRIPWHEKMERPQEPKLVPITTRMSRFGKGFMLIPTPKLVDSVIRKVPRGKLITIGTIRKKLAVEHGADVTCPLTTGIFIRIVAEAAEEARAKGGKRITPYWRVVRDKRFSCAASSQAPRHESARGQLRTGHIGGRTHLWPDHTR